MIFHFATLDSKSFAFSVYIPLYVCIFDRFAPLYRIRWLVSTWKSNLAQFFFFYQLAITSLFSVCRTVICMSVWTRLPDINIIVLVSNTYTYICYLWRNIVTCVMDVNCIYLVQFFSLFLFHYSIVKTVQRLTRCIQLSINFFANDLHFRLHSRE